MKLPLNFPASCDSVIVKIISLKLILAFIYRPPPCTMIDTSNRFSLLEDLRSSDKHVTVLGDLNIPHVIWISRPSKALDTAANALVEFHQVFNISQLVPGATRRSSVLDIILTTEPSRYHNCSSEAPISSYDHNAIVCNIGCSDNIKTAVYKRHTTSKNINYVELERKLQAIV